MILWQYLPSWKWWRYPCLGNEHTVSKILFLTSGRIKIMDDKTDSLTWIPNRGEGVVWMKMAWRIHMHWQRNLASYSFTTMHLHFVWGFYKWEHCNSTSLHLFFLFCYRHKDQSRLIALCHSRTQTECSFCSVMIMKVSMSIHMARSVQTHCRWFQEFIWIENEFVSYLTCSLIGIVMAILTVFNGFCCL
jgi:hypothetical protein